MQFLTPCQRYFIIKLPSDPGMTKCSLCVISLDLRSPANTIYEVLSKAIYTISE